MASFNTTGLRFFPYIGGTALSAFTRVAVGATGQLVVAGPTAADVGVLDLDVGGNANSLTPEVSAAVRMPTCPGSKKYIADTAISAWVAVYKSTTGYVTVIGSFSSGQPLSGVTATQLGIAAAPSGATVAATALGSVFEVIPLVGLV